MPDIAVSVQAAPVDLRSWLSLARRLESSGFHGLLVGDHPGSGASPWPALGSAAAATQTLQLGTYVVQAGVREPTHVAADAATLDILAPGRVLLGVGAGHTPREWADIGQERPSPRQRAERLAEFVEAVAALLRGQTVTQEGGYLALRESRLEDLPVGRGSGSPSEAGTRSYYGRLPVTLTWSPSPDSAARYPMVTSRPGPPAADRSGGSPTGG
jgi:alkanesulfonate monooxygenase SsuD/methylene tetrahydromethanopterin reductase-like flavin-dependent oxidoreductase (luciferase family)